MAAQLIEDGAHRSPGAPGGSFLARRIEHLSVMEVLARHPSQRIASNSRETRRN